MRPTTLLSLSKKEKEQLEALLHSEKNLKQWKMYKAILLCSEKARAVVQKTLDLKERNLRIWIKRFRDEGPRGLKIKKQTGRPSLISRKKQEKIIKIIDSNPQGWSTKQIQKLVYEKGDVKYSKRHIYRISQKWGFSEVTPRPRSIRRASRSTIYRFKKKQKKQ